MSKSRRWPKILAILLVLVIVFILTAPASLLKNQVQQANLPVQVTGYQGRLLSGGVDTIFIEGVSYQNLSWDLNPVALLSGAFSALLAINDRHADLSVDVTFSDAKNWQATGLAGRLDLPPLTRMSPVLQLIKPQGAIEFNGVSAAQANTEFYDAAGTMSWQDASVRVNNMTLSLGKIDAELSDDGTHLYLDFTGQDSIRPQGQIKLATSGEYELTLTIAPEMLPANLSWFGTMGKPGDDGRVSYSFKGRI